MAFELDGNDISVTDSAAPPSASVVTAPRYITFELLEGGINWAEPSEEAFWERPPRSETLSLGGVPKGMSLRIFKTPMLQEICNPDCLAKRYYGLEHGENKKKISGIK